MDLWFDWWYEKCVPAYIQLILTFDVLNYFNNYKIYIHIVNNSLDLACPN